MNKKILAISISVLFFGLFFLHGCTVQNQLNSTNYSNVSQNNFSQNSNATVHFVNGTGATPESVASMVQGNNQFALDLYAKYQSNEGNVFFSPYSISSAMGMAYEGARGKTAEEMQGVFGFPQDTGVMRPAIATIYNDLNNDSGKYELRAANALWVQKNYPLLDSYENAIAEYYGGKATNLDFIRDTENSRLTINGWVENQTNSRIKDLIPSGSLDQSTRVVLTNAVYFKGNWLTQFNKSFTSEKNFTSGSKTTKVQMMWMYEDVNYTETSTLQALELPYEGNLSMLFILPKGDNLSAVEQSLTLAQLDTLRGNLTEHKVDISIPKFKAETSYSMSSDFAEMGMPDAFSADKADFSGITGKKDLYISAVIHKAFVEVNEEGTEAAAATAVMMSETAVPEFITFNADHPFIFLIQDRSDGNILFMGRMSDPGSSP